MSVRIHLERFEGPLGLLLHLIREQEMDIFDIDISKITQQYLDYIKTLRQLDLEVAGDFIAMAATLLQIKSRMLLPNYNGEGEEVEAEDPRKELVQRLLEYQKYQDAAKTLGERFWVGRDLWLRGERLDLEHPGDDEIIVEDNPLFSLISAYRTVARAMRSGIHRVVSALQSIASRVMEIKDKLVVGQRTQFDDLISEQGENRPNQVLVTFLSLLELAKMGFVSLFQSDNFAEIHIDTKRQIEGNIMAQIEDYDAAATEQLAEEILAHADTLIEELLPLEEAAARAGALDEGQFEGATDAEIEAEEKRLESSDESWGGIFPDPITGGAT